MGYIIGLLFLLAVAGYVYYYRLSKTPWQEEFAPRLPSVDETGYDTILDQHYERMSEQELIRGLENAGLVPKTLHVMMAGDKTGKSTVPSSITLKEVK